MIRCNTTIFTLCVAFLFTSMIPQIMEAQHFSRVGIVGKTDTLDREKDANKGIILKPVVEEYLFYDPYQDIYTLQSGLFLGPSHAGIETTIRHTDHDLFASLFFGALSASRSGSPQQESFLIGGFSFGRQYLLSGNRLDLSQRGPEFYMRLSPGIGLAGRGVFTDYEPDFYMGVYTSAILGANLRISNRTSFFMQGGGRVFWFPALDEIGFMGVPVISVGIQFTTSPELPMVRY
jgi:hypothetical protein